MNFIKDKNYWVVVGRKIVETLISVKIWVIFSIMVTSTWLLIHQFIDGNVWGTVNAAVISCVIVVREGFKIKRQKNNYVVEDINNEDTSQHNYYSQNQNIINKTVKKNNSMIFD